VKAGVVFTNKRQWEGGGGVVECVLGWQEWVNHLRECKRGWSRESSE
jgi:hypothetical protein